MRSTSRAFRWGMLPRGGMLPRALMALVVGTVVAGAALTVAPGAAKADWDHHHGWDRDHDRGYGYGYGHEWHPRGYWGRPGWGAPVVVGPGYYPPPVVYGPPPVAYVPPPPPVYYAPRPIVVAPLPGLTVVLPLH